MLSRLRIFLLLAAVPVAAQVAVPAGEPAVAPAAAPEPVRVSPWAYAGSLRTALGWRDNLLLSPFAPLGRAFGRAELEAFALRERGAWQALAFVNGEALRYFAPPPETDGEQQWFGHAEVRWRPRPAWLAALKADAFWQDAVIDLSDTEAVRTIAPTRVRGAFATAAGQVPLPAGFALEPLVQVKRTDYRTFPGDYDETKTGARLAWRRGDAFGVSAAWFGHRRAYAERAQFTAGGRALPGTRLRFEQRHAEVRATAAWSAGGAWRAALTAGRMENRDGASGFFDYDQKRARLETEWQRGAWRVVFDGEAKRMDYRGQTVGAGTAPPPRIGDSFEITLRAERELSDRWTVFAEYGWERSRSNETGFSYRANTGLAGVQRNF